jgi:hypothetical protein
MASVASKRRITFSFNITRMPHEAGVSSFILLSEHRFVKTYCATNSVMSPDGNSSERDGDLPASTSPFIKPNGYYTS